MAGVGLKISILQKSIATFTSWLDSCDELLDNLPSELQSSQPSTLRELALKYKDLLLQMKERCSYIEKVNSLCLEIGEETSENKGQSSPDDQSSHNPELANLATEVRDLNTRFTTTCIQAKRHYTDLSNFLAITDRPVSGFSQVMGDFSSHFPTGSRSSSRGKSARKSARHKRKKKSKSLYVEEEHENNDSKSASKGGEAANEVKRSPKLKRSRSWSVPTDLDDIISQQASRGALRGQENAPGVVSINKQQNPAEGSNKQEGHSKDKTNIDISSQAIKRAPLEHSKSLDDDAQQVTPAFIDELSPTSLLGLKRSKRPKSAIILNGDEAQFCYLDEQGSPINSSLSNSPVLKVRPTSNKVVTTPTGKPIMLKFERAARPGQRLSVCSIGDTLSLSATDDYRPHPLTDSQRGSINENASLLSVGSSLLESSLSMEAGENVDSGRARLSRSMDQLVAVSDKNGKTQGLSGRLRELSLQLQEFVHSIAESRKCSLQSLALELHLGEIKAMLTILEVQDLELTRLRAAFSPQAKRRLEKMESLKTVNNSPTYSQEQVASSREEILKLNDRVGILRRHCTDAVEQNEEVLELVVQYEKQFNSLKDFLVDHTSRVEAIKKRMAEQPDETWNELSEELTTVSEEKPQLKRIHELSVHLLYLEPIFDGSQIQEDLKRLTERLQQLTLKIFGLLEEQAKLRTEGLLMESSVMSSWITEAGLSVQALAKKARKPITPKAKLANTKETLTQELYRHQSSLETISNKLQPILAVLNSDETPNLDELVCQVENNRKSLRQIETNLQDINIESSCDNLSPNSLETEFPRSKASSEGIRKHSNTYVRSFNEMGVNEQIKQLQKGKQIEPPPKSKGRDDDQYAEIGSLQAQILSERGSGPDSRGGTQRPTAIQDQRPSLYERLDLPSPLVEFDHAPSRLLDNAIEMLPQTSSTPSLPHTPTNSSTLSTPSHHPNGNVVQYAKIDVSHDHRPGLPQDNEKSSSVSNLDKLPGQKSSDPTYAEIGKKEKKFPDYADINKFRHNSTGSLNISQRLPPKYAEVEVKRLSQLATDDKYTEIDVQPEPVSTSGEERVKGKTSGRWGMRKLSLHEELLEFIGEEWADLSLKKTPHQAALDEAALDQSLSSIANHELRAMCQRFVRGIREIGAGVQGVVEQISLLKTPTSPDLERVHSAIDQCQKLLDRLNKLHPRLDSYNSESFNVISSLGRTPNCARVAQLIEIRLFEVSTLWYSANLKTCTHMKELRSQEGDINYLYRQLQQLSRVLKEASALLAHKDTVTNVDDYLNNCKVMFVKLCDLSDLRKQVSSDIKETVPQSPQTAITRELMEQMKEVNTQWKSISKQLQKMPTLEHLLIQLSLKNIADELVAMETAFVTLEVRHLSVDEAATNYTNCKAQVERARLLSCSLTSIKAKLFEELSRQQQPAPTLGDNQSDSPQKQQKDLEQPEALVQCEELLKQVESILNKTERLCAQLSEVSDLVVQFHTQLNDLQLWVTDTVSMLQLSAAEGPASVTQLRGKHQAIFQQIVTRQPKLTSVQSLAERLVTLPSNQAEKQLIESQLNEVCAMWDNLCKQIVPAGSLPQVMTPMAASGRKLAFEPPTEFDDIQQMVDWLTMLDYKLQPKPIIVGDVKQIRRSLQDLQIIASEVRSREIDYNRFVDNTALPTSLRTDSLPPDFDPELSSSIRSMLGVSTPDGVYQVPPKFVQFYDESTLERRQRKREITDQHESKLENGNVGTDAEANGGSTPLEDSLTKYHSNGPETGQWNGIETKPRSGMELGLDQLEPRRPYRQLSDMSHDENLSLTSFSSQLLSPMDNEDVYQLFLLWRSIWVSLGQQKKRLEGTLEVWRHFEEKKEEFCDFLTQAEERVGLFFRTLSETKDLSVVQSEITKQQVLYKEVPLFTQRLSILSNLTDDLITNRHSNDDTSDLKDMMANLNKRWSVVTESVSQHQPTVAAMATRWVEFYQEYQSFTQWAHKLDTDMSNLNPFISDLSSVRIQLEKMKEIQQELRSREGGVESVRLLAYKLLQGVGGCHINTSAVHIRLDNLGRRVKQLETLAEERRADLEKALTEKQDFISNLADTLAWLTQAEKHLISQKPLGDDFDTVHSQYQAHQVFWKEVLEQQPKIRSVISLGGRLANESHWTQGTGEDLRAQFVGVAPRWEKVWSEGEEWGQLLVAVHPEMEAFQSLCSETGQKLSDCELIAERLDPVSHKLPILDKQMEALNIFEANLVSIGKQLEAIVLSQRKQVQLGIRVNSDLFKMVKGYHHRWNQLKQLVDQRRVAIQAAQIQYDPANLSTTELPAGWKRANTENRTPYFINVGNGGHTQWEHPELSALNSSLQEKYCLTSYPSPAYPIALRLRVLQQKTQLVLLRTKSCIDVCIAHNTDLAHKSSSLNHQLSFYDLTVLVIDLFQTVEDERERPVARENKFYINKAVEMSTCWIRDIFDIDHRGKVGFLPMIVAAVCLSKGKLEDKYRALFKVISGGEPSIDIEQVTRFLEYVMMIGQSVSNTPFCSLHAVDVCARECFKKYVGVGRLHLKQFISWLHSEPLPLSWLPILHRLGASEHSRHEIKCSVCKRQPFYGFRYRCVQCVNFDMCQSCYWAGLTGKGHDRTKHFMEEYCIPKPAEEVNFLKTIRKSFRLKKKAQLEDPHPPGHESGGEKASHTQPGTPVEQRWTLASRNSSKSKHAAYVPVSIGGSRRHTLGRDVGASMHPGRRFTVHEDSQSVLRMSGSPRLQRARGDSSPPPGVAQSSNGWRRGQSKPPPASVRPTNNLEQSLTKISKTSKSLSFRLRSLREKQGSPGAKEGSPEPEDIPDRNGTRSPTPEEELRRRNAMLQGRVQLLQEHNLRLENCISQLKLIASVQHSTSHGSLRPLPSQPRPRPLASPRPPPLPLRGFPQDTYDVPPSHKLGAETYDVPPRSDITYDLPPNGPADYEVPPSMRNGPNLYSVPVTTKQTSSPDDIYNVPLSTPKITTPELYSVPMAARINTNSSELYSVPPSRGKPITPELYSVPPSSRGTSSPAELYDIPPTKTATTPLSSLLGGSKRGQSTQESVQRPSNSGLNRKSFQGGNEMYDIPPPRLLSAQPNPKIPPPKLPQRTNTAPASGTNKSSSLM